MILFRVHFTQNLMLIPNRNFQIYFYILGDIGGESLAKISKRPFLGKIRNGYGLLWSQSIDWCQGYLGPLRGRYGAGRFCGEIAGIAVYLN